MSLRPGAGGGGEGYDGTTPYFHSGAAQTLEEVVEHVPHRTAGKPASDLLTDPANRALLVHFLRSIDSTKLVFAGP